MPAAAEENGVITVYVGNGWFCPTGEECEQPYTVHVPNGGTVRWEWAEGTHTTTSCADETYSNCTADQGWDSGIISTPGEFEYTFGPEDDDRTVYYLCTLHSEEHRGVIVLTDEPIPTATPTPPPPTGPTPTSAPTPEPTPVPMLGDTNGDGAVTMTDALIIAQAVVELIDPETVTLETADVNRDGEITMLDAMLVAQCVIGFIIGLPPGASPEIYCPPDDPPPIPPKELGYQLAQVIPDATFNRMLGMYPVPGADDEVLIVTQPGYIWRVSRTSAFEPTIFADLTDRVVANAGEEGLLGFAFSPDFLESGRVYAYYNGPKSSEEFYAQEILSRFLVTGGLLDKDSEEKLIVLDDREPWHNGGQLKFGPDGYLYLSIGDEGWVMDPHDNGQNIETLFGSVIRIDVSTETGYDIPPDNPFAQTPEGRGEIYAWGFRNPWRFSFDRETEKLWLGDVGQWNWEEVNVVHKGGNYGWNVMEGFVCFGQSDPDNCDKTPYVLPRAVYNIWQVPECAIIGGFVYRGAALPHLHGWYVYGDYCTGKIWALDAGANDSPPILIADTGKNISSFGELPDGEIVVLTFQNAVYTLEEIED